MTPTNTPETVERLRPLLSDCPICGSPPRRNGKKGAGGVVCYAGSHRLQIIDDTQPLADAQWNEMAKDWADRQDRDAIVEKRLHLIEHIASVEHTANAIDRNGLNSCSRQLRDAARVLRAALSAPSPASGEAMRAALQYARNLIGPDEIIDAALAPKPDEVTVPEGMKAWVPTIGERVKVNPSCDFAAGWEHIDLWVAGVCVAENGNGLNVTVSEQWPIPSRHWSNYKGQTDCFYVGRDNAPDDLVPLAYTPKPSPDRVMEGYALPCDVRIPPATTIKAGCDIAVLKRAMVLGGRPKSFPATPDARLREENEALRGLLANLEKACDNLAATRSRETYLSMVDRDHATPQLLALDDARRDVRAALGGETGK